MKAYLLYKYVLLVCLLVFCYNKALSQPFIEFQKSYGGSQLDAATGIIQNSFGGYTLAGVTYSPDGQVSGYHASSDFWIVNTDSLGNLLWEVCLGGSGFDYCHGIAQTSNGGSIVCGESISVDGDVTGNRGSSDAWLVKLDDAGSLLWKKCYGGTESEAANDIIPTYDGGYIFCGYSSSNNGDLGMALVPHYGSNNLWVLKLDSIGNVQWSRAYGGSNDDVGESIVQTFDGGFAFLGSTRSPDLHFSGGGHHGLIDLVLGRIDSTGNLLWTKCFGGSDDDGGIDLKQTPDSGYILIGYTSSIDGQVSSNHDSDFVDIWVVKTDKVGNLEWEKCLGGKFWDEGVSVLILEDSSYMVSATVFSNDGDVTNNHGSYDHFLAKLDHSGQLLWTHCYGGFGADWNGGLIEAGHNQWAMCGTSGHNSGDVSVNHGLDDFWLVKLYKYPPIEASIQLIPIEELCILSDSEQVSIMVINNGESNFHNFPVSYSVNGVSPVTEIITDTVHPMDTLHYIFQTRADLNSIGHYRITANISVAGDIHAFNDSSSFEVNSINHLSVPVSMGFEDHEINTGWYSHDLDGDGRTGIFNTLWPHSGSKTYTFWAAITLTPENLLWRSCINLNISTNYMLSYWTKVDDSFYPYSLEVYLNTVPELAGATLISTAPVAPDTAYHQIFSAFTVPQTGTYYVGFRAFASNTTSLLFLDDIVIDINTSISEYEKQPDLFIFPNPAGDHITILGLKLNDEIKVFGIHGNLVMQNIATHTQEKISLNGITPGMYLIEVGGTKWTKFVMN